MSWAETLLILLGLLLGSFASGLPGFIAFFMICADKRRSGFY